LHLLTARDGQLTAQGVVMERLAKVHVTVSTHTLVKGTQRCARMGDGQWWPVVNAMVRANHLLNHLLDTAQELYFSTKQLTA
jgi:hypothetical protein